jgi:hypothetical protein
MAKQKAGSAEPPRLRVPREEARRRIQERIDIGIQLRDGAIENAQQLDRAEDEYRKWSDYNADMLRGLFTTEELKDEYIRQVGGLRIWRRPPPFGYLVKEFRDDAQRKVTCLESIRDRLDLYEEVQKETVQQPTTPGYKEERRKGLENLLNQAYKHLNQYEELLLTETDPKMEEKLKRYREDTRTQIDQWKSELAQLTEES